MENLELQFLQTELIRVSEWIRFSDKKSAFLSAYYSLIFASIFSQKNNIVTTVSGLNDCILCLAITLIICTIVTYLIGIFSLLSSVFPRTNNVLTRNSLFYYGNIAEAKFIDYFEKMEKLTEYDSKKQFVEQIHTNSVIANKKMKNVKRSTIYLFISLIGIVLFSIIF